MIPYNNTTSCIRIKTAATTNVEMWGSNAKQDYVSQTRSTYSQAKGLGVCLRKRRACT